MQLVQLIIPAEAAHDTIYQLGEVNCVFTSKRLLSPANNQGTGSQLRAPKCSERAQWETSALIACMHISFRYRS